MAGAMRERFVQVTTQLLADDDRLALVLADLSADMFAEAGRTWPLRVLNVGIREQLLVSVAGGLALAGMRPIAHSFAPFLIERPFEQIKLDLNHQGVGAVLVSAGASYDIASGGRSHQCPADVALLDTLPDWTVHVPGHPDEAEAQLRAEASREGLAYLRLSNQCNAHFYATDVGTFPRFRHLKVGTQGVIIVVGPLADAALAALHDVDVTVLYASTVRPFDHRTLRAEVLRQANARIVLVEPYLQGTSLSQVSRTFEDTPHRAIGLGVAQEELRSYGRAEQHAIAHGLDSGGIRRRVLTFLSA